ncbi:MAG: flavin reductase family protein [Shinella sp.]|nr:flavin reductase family protein [Shinella sp.]
MTDEISFAGEAAARKQKFLGGMSLAACTVNIVTTDGPAGRFGVTVSAMSSVSADGERPTLLVCVHHLSPAAQAIIENGVFAVNVLRDSQTEISDTFAGRIKRADGDKFRCTRWRSGATGAPYAEESLVAFDCRVSSVHKVGTHHVFIGAVEDIHAAGNGTPLLYSSRGYGRPSPLPPSPAGNLSCNP